MWSYSGLKDKSRISDKVVPDEIFEDQVRSLTKLTKKNKVPCSLAKPYATKNRCLMWVSWTSIFYVTQSCHHYLSLLNYELFRFVGPCTSLLASSSSRRRELPEESDSDDEAPETTARQDKDEIEETTKRMDSTSISPPSVSSGVEKLRKQKRAQEDLESSSTSKSADVPLVEATASMAAPVVASLFDIVRSRLLKKARLLCQVLFPGSLIAPQYKI
jgi:hypothetical protein